LARKPRYSMSQPLALRRRQSPVPGHTLSSTSRSLLSASASFTRRVIMGKRVVKPAAVLKPNSVASKASSDMINALSKVHSVFSRFATSSPRFRSLRLDSAPVLDMQLQSYRMGSRSARVVAQRARASDAFFMDCAALQFDVRHLSPFQVATWVRSRSADGTKSAAPRAACTLRCVQNATDWDLHLHHPLVRCQIMPAPDVTNAPQPAQTAKTPSVKIVMAMESLIQTAAPLNFVAWLVSFHAWLTTALLVLAIFKCPKMFTLLMTLSRALLLSKTRLLGHGGSAAGEA